MVSASIRRAENTGGQGPRTLTLISANLCANCYTRVSTNFVDSVFAPLMAFVFRANPSFKRCSSRAKAVLDECFGRLVKTVRSIQCCQNG
jgi:hypothetical protein